MTIDPVVSDEQLCVQKCVGIDAHRESIFADRFVELRPERPGFSEASTSSRSVAPSWLVSRRAV